MITSKKYGGFQPLKAEQISVVQRNKFQQEKFCYASSVEKHLFLMVHWQYISGTLKGFIRTFIDRVFSHYFNIIIQRFVTLKTIKCVLIEKAIGIALRYYAERVNGFPVYLHFARLGQHFGIVWCQRIKLIYAACLCGRFIIIIIIIIIITLLKPLLNMTLQYNVFNSFTHVMEYGFVVVIQLQLYNSPIGNSLNA